MKIRNVSFEIIDDQMAELVEGLKKILDEIWSADPKGFTGTLEGRREHH